MYMRNLRKNSSVVQLDSLISTHGENVNLLRPGASAVSILLYKAHLPVTGWPLYVQAVSSGSASRGWSTTWSRLKEENIVSLRRREFSSAMSFRSSIISLASCVRICAQINLRAQLKLWD